MSTLKVLPNPFFALDAAGKPAGVVLVDVHEHSMNRGHIGATQKNVARKGADGLERIGGVVANYWAPLHDCSFAWELGKAVELPVTQYYLSEIAASRLVAFDQETADQAGVPFRPAAEVWRDSWEAAADEYASRTGKRPPSPFDAPGAPAEEPAG